MRTVAWLLRRHGIAPILPAAAPSPPEENAPETNPVRPGPGGGHVRRGGRRHRRAGHNNATNGAPASYPSIYAGCHYGACATGSGLPAQVSGLGNPRATFNISTPDSGEWDAAFDLWFDPSANPAGQNYGAELMIWSGHRGGPQPIGGRVADVDAWSRADGTKVQLWDCFPGNANQTWRRAGNTFVSADSGKRLDATELGAANGTGLRIRDCGRPLAGNQRWRLG